MFIENEKDKQVLIYHKDVDNNKLIKELCEGVPKLKPIIKNNEILGVNMRFFRDGDVITLWVPKEIDKKAIDKIVKEHTKEAIEDVI